MLDNNIKNISHLNVVLFFTMMVVVNVLIFKPMAGIILITVLALLFAVLINPKYIYFVLVASLSFEGFAAIQGITYARIVGIILILGLLLRLAMTKEELPRDNIYMLFYMFSLGSLVSILYAFDLISCIKMFVTFVSLFIFYFISRYFLVSIRDINKTIDIVTVSTIVVFIIVQAFELSVRDRTSTRIASGIGDPNSFASYLLVLIPLSLYKVMNSAGITRFIYICSGIGFTLMVASTLSRGGMLGFLGVIGVLVHHFGIGKIKQLMIILLVIAFILIVYVPDDFWQRADSITNQKDSSITTRLDNYKAALKMFLDYPIAGVGLNNFKYISGNYGATGEKVVHNTYLEILSGGGVLSFIPFVLILLNCWKKLKTNKFYKKTVNDLLICLKASFVSLIITYFFLSAGHHKMLWFTLALISSVHYLQDKLKEQI